MSRTASETPEDLAEGAAFAAIEFDAVTDNIEELFTAKKWDAESSAAGISLRVAVGLVKKTKAELIDGTSRLIADDDGEAYSEILEDLQNKQKRFEMLAELLRVAATRWMVAGRCSLMAMEVQT